MGSNDRSSYTRLWEAFVKEYSKLQTKNNINAVSHLLEKYTSAIPSITLKVFSDGDAATYAKHPDISLFDHLKVTAATAACFYDYYSDHYPNEFAEGRLLKNEITGDDTWTKNAAAPLMLIGGDISGVQDFIYTISSKGALKSLKGRSFFLEMLTEHAVQRLLDAFGLSRCNVIFTGGGHFYLLAPNIESGQNLVESVNDQINGYLLDAFNATLQLHVAWIPFRKVDFKNASLAWQELSARLEESKQRKWKSHLHELLAEPSMPDGTCLMQNCAVCGREDKPLVPLSEDKEGVLVCDYCRAQYMIGDRLQSAARRGSNPVIYRMNKPPGNRESFCIEEAHFVIEEEYSPEMGDQADVVYHLNDWELDHFAHPSSRPLMAGIYLPDDRDCRELEQMASHGFGMSKIGVLMMDVDHLGNVFARAVPEAERTLSRMASLSRNLSLFFKYHINGILAFKSGYPQPYRLTGRDDIRMLTVVYSGGDDVFLIGHWLDILEAAFDLDSAFQKFTANPYLTVSAGIVLGDPHEPVYRLAEHAKEAERAAKGNQKDSITIFNNQEHVFKWVEAQKIQGHLSLLSGFTHTMGQRLILPEGSISQGILYRLLLLTREHKEKGGWLMPRLAYLFGRYKPKAGYEETWGKLKDYVFSTKVDWHLFEMSVLILIMMLRKETNQ